MFLGTLQTEWALNSTDSDTSLAESWTINAVISPIGKNGRLQCLSDITAQTLRLDNFDRITPSQNPAPDLEQPACSECEPYTSVGEICDLLTRMPHALTYIGCLLRPKVENDFHWVTPGHPECVLPAFLQIKRGIHLKGSVRKCQRH